MNRWYASLVAAMAAVGSQGAFALDPGFGTVDLDGVGGNPAITFEQVRFYKPSTTAFPTYFGSVPIDYCSGSDRCGGPMTFDTTFGGTLTATATVKSGAEAIVYQDLNPHYGGLGVVKLGTDSSGQPKVIGHDEINKGDRLKLSFEQQVNVVGFHFFEGDHSRTNYGDYGFLSIDGGAWQKLSLFPNYVTNDPSRWYTGSVFEFKKGNQDYYLGAVKITTAIPEPQVVLLMLAGLCAVGVVARARGSRLAPG